MTAEEIRIAILSDFEDKKQFPANFDSGCGYCTNLIVQGQPFIFVGGKKMCDDCQGDVTRFLEES